MITLRTAASAAPFLLLAGCAGGPVQQVTLSGTVPAGARYALVVPAGDGAPTPAAAALEACVRAAGLVPGQPATVLLHSAHALRPARAAVLRTGEDPPRGRGPSRRKDREELTLTLTDRASGAVL